jgi:hypothetical protein
MSVRKYPDSLRIVVYEDFATAICEYILLIIAKKRFYIEKSLHTIYLNTNLINSVPELDSAQLSLW